MKIYNSLTKKKEPLKTIEDKKIRLYACGITVYDYCHIGHARMMLVFDMVVRYLRYKNYAVHYVQNITDIDDKIIKRAQENKEDYTALTTRFIDALHADRKALSLLPPDEEPRATQYIDQMISMINELINKDLAYVSEDGDVLYSVSYFKNYGKLSHRDLADLKTGARVEISQTKRDPLDFVLWKKAKPGEPAWPSPWGEGRPGWHIECSAMAKNCLGEQIDIHGGGMDLKFPHHENEIAQTEGCTEKTFANLWMHVGFLQVDDEKMSKSLGNFFLIRDALKLFSPEQIRYFMLSSHYRQPINYSEANLKNAQEALGRFYLSLRDIEILAPETDSSYEQRFCEAMEDDFNTSEALSVLFDLTRKINKQKNDNKTQAGKLAGLLKKLAGVLGLLQEAPETFFKGTVTSDKDDEINALVIAREKARAEKDWAKADQIRQQLDDFDIIIEDGAEGTTWRKKI